MREITVAAHQPNFFPWPGWFDKLFQADIFIILDDVQFPRTGAGNWGNRVKIQMNGLEKWLTASVDKGRAAFSPFNQIRFSPGVAWRSKLAGQLVAAYRKAPFFTEAMDFIEPLLMNGQESLVDYNLSAITALIRLAGLEEGKLMLSSSFKIKSSGSVRLAELVQAVGGNVYIYGGGCSGYQKESDFTALGIKPRPQNYTPARYAQHHQKTGSFLGGLSVLDYLFCAGPGKLKDLF